MKLITWLRSLKHWRDPNAAETLRHLVWCLPLFGANALVSWLLSMPILSKSKAIHISQIFLDSFLIFAVAMFCLHAALGLTLNSCRAIQRRVQNSLTVFLVVFSTLIFFTICIDIFLTSTRDSTDIATLENHFAWDISVMRRPDLRSFQVPSTVHSIDLYFVIPSCKGCRYLALMDAQEAVEIYSRDTFNNFVYPCKAEILSPGRHALRVLEINAERKPSGKAYDFNFEVMP